MSTHKLKIWPEYFDPVQKGLKKFEIRKNDRDFKVGDYLRLQEYEYHKSEYTGNEVKVLVTYIYDGDLCGMDGFVIMSIDKF